jgi:hypothetical protein
VGEEVEETEIPGAFYTFCSFLLDTSVADPLFDPGSGIRDDPDSESGSGMNN